MNGKIKTLQTRNTCNHYCTHKKNCVNIYNANIQKCLNNCSNNFFKELKNFSKKYSSNNSCKMSPEVSSLTPLPHASKELVRIPEQSALTTEPDADSNDNPIHPIHSNEPFIIHTILCLTGTLFFFLLFLYKINKNFETSYE